MDETPRMNAKAFEVEISDSTMRKQRVQVVLLDEARQLERELAEANQTIRRQLKYAEAVAKVVDSVSPTSDLHSLEALMAQTDEILIYRLNSGEMAVRVHFRDKDLQAWPVYFAPTLAEAVAKARKT